ncbi:Sulfate/thiosulfate import ATP-binding protein CysA [Vibrio aerogenes CECT 7868]|uniref:Sulfate/thiosulfate import ATP-binding protein CysA n=1 Tax=Vibrio aerogenes CECT 7868 TaxID=1216006 RepID=A0A1M6A2N3_9VIBR|nr:ATP-binding cassette domain-containing protein [Vibrio aerogenes]SHI30716.1 Sulfate/thiosulfate import ATP-binding protein CysA [Vibrio aerogenes CECT 7868]
MIMIDVQKKLGTHNIEAAMTIRSTGITALYGHSGAGKTSIINMIAGLLAPDRGKIIVNDRVFFESELKINLPPEQRRIGYIFQDKRLFHFLSVKKNLLFSGRTDEKSALFEEIVTLLDIDSLLSRKPASLSGGEAQRVAIGRALLSLPDLLLLDEPMSFLDHQCRQALMAYLKQIPQRFSVPVILVTHAADEIKQLADHLFFIENGQTRIGTIRSADIC